MASSAASCILDARLRACFGPAPVTIRGATRHYGAHPRAPKIIYPSGKFVIVRDLEDPLKTFVYRGHNAQTTVAKFSPSGYWVASGDAHGKVRIWSWDHAEHILKIEVQIFAGPVHDLEWDSESKRIAAVGEGSGMMAKVFMWDTGNSVGEIVGHTKRILSVAYKPTRPFRLFTASEDSKVIFFKGPPFQLDHSNQNHTNYVNCIRYSPDGNRAVSVGSDKKIVIYDGKEGGVIGEIDGGEEHHAGSIYSVCWSPDSAQILTCSADKTVKLWNVDSGQLITTFTFHEVDSAPDLCDMQQSVLWMPAPNGTTYMLSFSLNGDINFLDPSSPNAPVRKIHGHQVAIKSMIVSPLTQRFYTGSFDGCVFAWEFDGTATRLKGDLKRTENSAVHSGAVSGVAICRDGLTLLSVGWDDRLRVATVFNGHYHTEIQLEGQPVGIVNSSAPSSDLALLATRSTAILVRETQLLGSLNDLRYSVTALALFGEEEVALGGSDNKVHIYALTDGGNSFGPEIATIEGHRGEISTISYSPNGQFIAVGDANREVNVWIRGTGVLEAKVKSRWTFHTTRVTSLAWAPNSVRLASGSLDENIYLWNIEDTSAREHLRFAHKDGVTALGFIDDNVLLSAGNDQCVCRWDFSYSEVEQKK